MHTIEDRIKNAVEHLYPGRSKTPLPPTLPLSHYAGTYYHPGYQNITLTLADSSLLRANETGGELLVADRSDFTWRTINYFKHVSGEHWVMYGRQAKRQAGIGALEDYGAAQFEIGADGKANRFGIEWRDTASQVIDGWIWYERIE